MRIVLVRHGRSAHVHAGWLDHRGLHAWRAAYDQAGLARDDEPPAPLRDVTARAGLLVASDLQRAVESALLLRADGAHVVSPLLREVSLPIPGPSWLRMPLGAWGTLIGLSWMIDLASGRGALHMPARARAGKAAAWMTSLAAEHDEVVAVTHGAFRRYLYEALLGQGWRSATGRPSYAHWSAWEFVR